MIYILIATVGTTIGIAGTYLFMREQFEIRTRLATLEHFKAELENLPTHKHYSYNQVAAIHDAIAVILSAKSDQDAERARLDTALSILATLYKNPQSYDPEKPNNR